MVGWPLDARPAQSTHGRGHRAQHLPLREVLEPHHVENPVLGEAGQVKVEGLARVQVILGEDVRCARRPTVRIDSGELDHVEPFGRASQEVASLGLHQAYPRIVDPVVEVVPMRPSQDSHRGSVDFHARNLGCVGVQRRQDVEAAPHADDEHLRACDRRRVIRRRVDGLVDSGKGLPAPVIVDRVGEGEVVLRQQVREPSQERFVLADQSGKAEGPRVRWPDTGELDPSHGVPGDILHAVR